MFNKEQKKNSFRSRFDCQVVNGGENVRLNFNPKCFSYLFGLVAVGHSIMFKYLCHFVN